MEKYIGLSLSLCVLDLLKGKITFDQVFAVFSGTLIENEEQIDYVLMSYGETYWRDFSISEVEAVFKQVYISGKLIQPIVLHLEPSNTVNGHWVLLTKEVQNTIETSWKTISELFSEKGIVLP